MKLSKFEKFLYNRGLLKTFKYNLKTYPIHHQTISYLIEFEHDKKYVLKSFRWESTPEGEDFWSKIHYEWRSCLENNTL